jgi:hypothetical protein
VIIAAMRWVVALTGSKQDTERLLAGSLEDQSADPTEAGQLLLELHDSEGDETSREARRAVKADIDVRVRHINGFGKLRWGRNFEGVAIKTVRSFASTGQETQHVFAGTAHDHMLPREFADMVERLGFPRPPLPVGLDVIEALGGAAVTALAASNPVVGWPWACVGCICERARIVADWHRRDGRGFAGCPQTVLSTGICSVSQLDSHVRSAS